MYMESVVHNGADFPIKPASLRYDSDGMLSILGQAEQEDVALWLLKASEGAGSWQSMPWDTYLQIAMAKSGLFYDLDSYLMDGLNELIQRGFVILLLHSTATSIRSTLQPGQIAWHLHPTRELIQRVYDRQQEQDRLRAIVSEQ